MTLNIVIADDHVITRKGIMASLLEMFPGAQIIECADASDVLSAIKRHSVDLALVDLFMPGEDGFSFLKKLCRNNPDLPVVVFSATDIANHVQRVIDIGVSGFIHKSSGFDSMNQALRTVIEGGSSFPDMAGQEKAPYNAYDFNIPSNRDALLNSLTKRQLETLRCLVQGMSNREIAAAMFISENTVKTHLKGLMLELNCNNRTEAVVLAQELGLLD